MSWNPHMDYHYVNTSYPYNSAGSFIEYFEGLTYEHVNFIFSGAAQAQESIHPSFSTRFYKYGFPESGTTAYYGQTHTYEVNDNVPRMNGQRRHLETSAALGNEIRAAVHAEWEGNENSITHEHAAECPRRHQETQNHQVIWQDDIDPDNMTYEELLDLGEAAGTQSRGLSQEQISLLPISKYKCGFFPRKRSRHERCVICQMDYKRGDRRITLPCNHIYHASCGAKWLGINKACPICFTEVFGDALKH